MYVYLHPITQLNFNKLLRSVYWLQELLFIIQDSVFMLMPLNKRHEQIFLLVYVIFFNKCKTATQDKYMIK